MRSRGPAVFTSRAHTAMEHLEHHATPGSRPAQRLFVGLGLVASMIALLVILLGCGLGGAPDSAGANAGAVDGATRGEVALDGSDGQSSSSPAEPGGARGTANRNISETPTTVSAPPNAIVERVVDGDTILADIFGRSETVRLIGIDTPETVAPTRPVECYGPEASAFLQALLPEGAAVTLLLDAEARDVYGRLLAYVIRDDGLFVNHEMLYQGYAAELSFAPNLHYSDLFAKAEASAIRAQRGLWGVCGGTNVPIG